MIRAKEFLEALGNEIRQCLFRSASFGGLAQGVRPNDHARRPIAQYNPDIRNCDFAGLDMTGYIKLDASEVLVLMDEVLRI
jgi:hypothetical protein